MTGHDRVTLLGCLAAALLSAAPRPVLADPFRRVESTDVPRGHLTFRVLARSEGLGNLVVSSIVQDADGFLWLGTEEGVYRFDGERFTQFSVEDGLTSSLVNVLGVAPDGAVCAGGTRGLACWDGEKFSRAGAREVPEVSIRSLATFDDRLWVGTERAGLYVQDRGGVFVPAPGWPGKPTTPITAMWADAAGLVVGNGATVELTTGNGAWRNIGDVGLGGDAIGGVLRDREGALWIRTTSHMWHLPRGAERATDLRQGFPTGYDATGTPQTMALGPYGDVLIGTDDGITYRDKDGWRTIGRADGMPAATTRTMLLDRSGTLWIGSAGLFELRGRALFENHIVASGLPGEIVWTYARDQQGTLWAGTNRCLVRARGGRWECLPGTEQRNVRTIVFPPQGGVFIGGLPSDILYIAPDGRRISSGEGDRPDHNVFALALGPEGDLWIGTRQGLYRMPGATPGPLERVAVPGTPDDAEFRSVVTVGNQLWATAAPGGLAVLDRGTWRVFGTAAGLLADATSSLLASSNGRFCAAYSEAIGLSCFRYDGRALLDIKHHGKAEGLNTGKVYFIGEDRQQRLWIGTGGGVDVLTPTGVDHFDNTDGLAGSDSASGAFLLDHDGTLWLGFTGGGTHVLAPRYHGAPPPPSTVFVGGQIGGHSIRRVREAGGSFEVPHDRNALAVEFTAGALREARRVAYQTRLVPLETAWSESHQREARYPALPPGSYRLEVQSRVDKGPWGPTAELRFRVLPAWWQTSWFIMVVGLIGAVALASGFAWRQRTVLRRRTRQLHQRSEASFRAVIDLMPDLISVYRDGKLIYLNRAICRFLGIDAPPDRWESLDLNDWIHPDDRQQIAELSRKLGHLDSQPASEFVEIRTRSADGSWRVCEISGVLVEIGGALTVVLSGRDATERKRMRAKLLVSDRMASLGTLAAGIAHEINNPLAYVTGNLEAASETLKAAGATAASDHADLGAAIEEARDGAERVRKIVQGLRLFSRSDDEDKRIPVALPGVIETAIRLTANEVRHRAQLVRELGPVPLVIADDGQLTQVFINLLVNAAHAIPEGRSDDNRITVRTRTDDHGRAVVEVQDTGRGMPPEVQTRVFDPFFTTKEVGGGTGLGLSICHGIVSGLGGQISIDSAPARGTVVRVVLPPALAVPAAPSATGGETGTVTAPLRRQRIMLVDDEPLVAQTIERLLRRDYDITIALCGRDAIEHITQGTRFDAIVSDVMMPNMTGIELMEELRRVAPDQAERLIFLSGGAFTAQTRERLDQLGVLQLEKPVSAKELRASILRIAHGSKSA